MRRPEHLALALIAAAWILGLAMILAHTIFVTNDSLSNYIHVWYIADRLYDGRGVPLHMPVLGHGDAYAFPYGFIPWMTAALLRPVLGDRVVTLWLVAGAVGVIAAQWWAFPELRRGWWTALLLANPMLVEGPLLGQLPFLWAVAMLFAAIAFCRRDHLVAATILLGLSQATHPAVMLPIVGPLVLARLWWEPRRVALIATYAASLVIAAPAVWLVLASPTVSDSSRAALLGNFFGTVSLRAIVVGAPFIGLLAMRTPLARVLPPIFVALVALNVVLVPIRHNEFAWTALTRAPDESLLTYINSPRFERGDANATYRILRVADGKIGMYQLVQAGAYLDAEPFPESIDRRSWDTESEYLTFLANRNVRYVIIYVAYDRRYGTNEHALLDGLASDPTSTSREPAVTCVSLVESNAAFDVYRIDTTACGSVRD